MLRIINVLLIMILLTGCAVDGNMKWAGLFEKSKGGVVKVMTELGVGSGFVISKSGDVLTNHHVVGTNTQVKVMFNDDQDDVCVGTVLRTHEQLDVALLTVTDCVYLDDVLVLERDFIPTIGEPVMAIGYPFALGKSASVGIVSSNYVVVQGNKYIPHDAALNPGNSGGPLFNAAGKVIGINSGGMGGTRGSGMSFAIPIEYVCELVDGWVIR